MGVFMQNENRKLEDIQSIVLDGCLKSFPCCHDMTIIYKDKTEEFFRAVGSEIIINTYEKYLTQQDRDHLEYLKHTQYKQSARLFKQPAAQKANNKDKPLLNKYCNIL